MALTEEALQKLSEHISVIHNSTNIGVIDYLSSMIIIDSGSDDDAGKHIYRILQKVFPNNKLQAVINTHSHADHCGGNNYLVNHAQCEIWASLKESKSIELPELQSSIIWGGRPFSDLETKFFKAQRPTQVTKILNTEPIILNDSNNNKILTIQPIPLPGHYFDQIGVLITDHCDNKKIFFLGDALFSTNILSKYWIPFLYDVDNFRKSLETIDSIDADYYIPSHGDIYSKENIHELSEYNKITTIETETLILKLLKNPMTPEELLKSVADYSSIKLGMGQYVLIGCTLRSYLSFLYNSKLIKFDVIDNRMLWSTL